MQNPTDSSADLLFDIKAPLASFDTVDLDDDEEDDEEVSTISNSDLMPATTPDRSISKCAESTSSSNSLGDNSEVSPVNLPVTPTATKKSSTTTKSGSPVKSNSEADNISIGSKDTNSSENNASAEEIQHRLKLKGRKYKDKSSNVKYEQIESTSDVSDQEKSDTDSPLPSFRLKSQPQPHFHTDSDSSDSDSGFIRSSFISTSSKDGRHQKANRKSNSAFCAPQYYFKDLGDSDSTPYSSPKLSRPALPPPLTKEENAIRSKRKAYEKRLQRLQVTTNPIERPRSTTPINIYGLDEYVNISSPEKSPKSASLEKLKITLPQEESYKGRSPRKSLKSCEISDSPTAVFNFNEDLLFTHTRSAILIQDSTTKGQSPKKILVPPCLSPKLSPARSPRAQRRLASSSKYSPRFIYNPGQSDVDHRENSPNKTGTHTANLPENLPQNWAKFDNIQTVEDKSDCATFKVQFEDATADDKESVQDKVAATDSVGFKGDWPSDTVGVNVDSPDVLPDDSIESRVNCDDEVLTIRIEETGDKRTCAIEYEDTPESQANVVGDSGENAAVDRGLTGDSGQNAGDRGFIGDSGQNAGDRGFKCEKENDGATERRDDDNFESLC